MQKAIELIEELKSLRLKNAPGRHDQKTHASYGGVRYTEREPDSTLIPGYSDLAVEAAANYIFDKRGPEPPYIDEMLDATDWGKGGRTLGEWADDILSTIRTKRLVDQSEGVLNKTDLDNMRQLDKTMWRTPKELRIIPNDRMPDYDISSASEEYGKSPNAIWLDVKPVGQWKHENGKFVITINADAEKIFGMSKRFVFWHELGHLTPDYEIKARIGDPRETETAAEYMDRFASEMSGEKS